MSTKGTYEQNAALDLTRESRRDIAKEIERLFRPMASKIHVTFDNNLIQIIVFPPSISNYRVPGGPYLLQVRDGTITEE